MALVPALAGHLFIAAPSGALLGAMARTLTEPIGGQARKTTLAIDALLDGDAERLTRKAVEMALGGDIAMRLCLDRLAPVRKDRPVTFALPTIETTADLPKASAALLEAVASGELTPSEAAKPGKLTAHRDPWASQLTDAQLMATALGEPVR